MSTVKRVNINEKTSTKIKRVRIPPPIYAGIKFEKNKLTIAEICKNISLTNKEVFNELDINKDLIKYLKDKSVDKKCKFIALSLAGKIKNTWEITSRAWLEEDIVCFANQQENLNAQTLAQNTFKKFDDNNIAIESLSKKNEVITPHLVTLDDYKKITPPEDFSTLLKLVKKFRRKKIVFINATSKGGGVALMRHALLRFFKLLNVNAHWFVMKPRDDIFQITKTKFHNVLQDVVGKDTKLTTKDKKLYNAWIKNNFESLRDELKDASIVVIDDPQPSGLIPHIKKLNPEIKIVFRSHIHLCKNLLEKKGSSQKETWDFIWENIKLADKFVSHPTMEFVPDCLNQEKLVFMPASTDLLDGLNKNLTKQQTNYYFKLFNSFLAETKQTPLDLKRPYLIQVSRFDPSKGIPDLIEAFCLLREKLGKKVRPQLVIVGNGSIDDPDGLPVLSLIVEMLKKEKYKKYKDDIKTIRIPHVDQLLNTLLRKSKICLQLSIKEGFEIKVTEALLKGIPVIAYNTGGIPLQIKHGLTGYLVKTGDIKKVSDYLYYLFNKKEAYKGLSSNALFHADKRYTTFYNALNWLSLGIEIT